MTHSRTEPYRTKVEEANQIIKSVQGKAYVAFSGGKDSLCVLHLISKINKNVLIFHWDPGRLAVPLQIEQQIRRTIYDLGFKNVMFSTSQKYNERVKKGKGGTFYKALFANIIPRLAEQGYNYCFLGLRKEESSQRRIRIKNNINLSQIKEIYPIQNWSWLDVWSYIISNKIPYLSFYDIYGEVIGYDKVRFGGFYYSELQEDKFGRPNIDGVLMWRFRNAKNMD